MANGKPLEMPLASKTYVQPDQRAPIEGEKV